MNIFILSTGRCGSTTFIKACGHISNYSADHESRLQMTGDSRLSYPDNHIEADNRLTWFLGRLEKNYGDNAFYVHLIRDKNETVNSFVNRSDMGIMKAWREGIHLNPQAEDRKLAEDYIDTANANIELFMRNKSRQMSFRLEQAKADFEIFWQKIHAEGNLNDALQEWNSKHNASQ